MEGLLTSGVLATVSKHLVAGIVAVAAAVVVVGFGLVRAAIRTAMLFVGLVVAAIGILLLTHTI